MQGYQLVNTIVGEWFLKTETVFEDWFLKNYWFVESGIAGLGRLFVL
jgi:hypothetical protein